VSGLLCSEGTASTAPERRLALGLYQFLKDGSRGTIQSQTILKFTIDHFFDYISDGPAQSRLSAPLASSKRATGRCASGYGLGARNPPTKARTGEASALPISFWLESAKEEMAMQETSGKEGCRQIDENTIELHAMGRLKKSSVSEHLDQCSFCRDRVAEGRSYISVLKHALGAFQRGKDHPSVQRDAGGGPRSDEE